MKKLLQSNIVSTGLAIFSMLFGAGNLMYPIQVGLESGDKNFFGMLGFSLTAVCLPIAGFVGMILFNGNYKNFFERLGKPIGNAFILACMFIIGPIVAIPRITTLSHTMIAPFLPLALQSINPYSSFLFCIIFLGITFLAAYKENRIVDVLGNVISPLLLASLSIIIIKGFFTGSAAIVSPEAASDIFKTNFMRGYQTLDLLGALFFSSIVLGVLKNTMETRIHNNPHVLALIGLKAGTIGVSLLGIVYLGMSFLGVYHGQGLGAANEGELFRMISFHVLGGYGAAIIATAVLMACLSTSIALSAVVAEYLHSEVFKYKVGYVPSLILVMLSCVPLSTAGLGKVLALTGGVITYVGYPVLIVLTFCNIAYKLVGFRPVKFPVGLTFAITMISYYRPFIESFFG